MFKFKNPKRAGSQLLKKYGYVEFGQFQPHVLHGVASGEVDGYFCANCKFLQKQEGTLYGSVCTKLQNAEVAEWGCCNLWDFKAKQEETPEQPEQPEQPAPEPIQKQQVQKPVQKTAPKPVVKPAPRPMQKPAQAPKPVAKPAPVQTQAPRDAGPISQKKLREAGSTWQQKFKNYFEVVNSDEPKVSLETWSDPGVYPSGAGGGPLASHPDIGGITGGDIDVKVLPKGFETYPDNDDLRDALWEFATLYAKEEWNIPVTEWKIKIEGNIVRLELEDVDTSLMDPEDYMPDRGDDRDPDEYLEESVRKTFRKKIRSAIRKQLKEILRAQKTK